jgi:subtilisin family serine protease
MSLAATASFADRILPLCEKAYYQNQVVVASRRNMPLWDNGYPAEFSSCISVDNQAFETPFRFRYLADRIVEYAAHGEEVPVAAAGGGYTTMTGTSFATPTIAGICALIAGAYPGLRPFEVKSLLKAWAVPLPE